MVEQAYKLRKQGLTYLEIGNQLGISKAQAHKILNPDKLAKYRQRANAYDRVRSNEPTRLQYLKKYWKQYHREKYRNDLQRKLAQNLRHRIYLAVKGQTKGGSAVNDLGCSILDLKQYLESQFQQGMNWDNYGDWHIDHVKPLSSFDLTDREQFLKACHYTNLQPLWAKQNIVKSNQYKETI